MTWSVGSPSWGTEQKRQLILGWWGGDANDKKTGTAVMGSLFQQSTVLFCRISDSDDISHLWTVVSEKGLPYCTSFYDENQVTVREQGTQQECSALISPMSAGSYVCFWQSLQLYVSFDFIPHRSCSTSAPVPKLTPQNFDTSVFLVSRAFQGQIVYLEPGHRQHSTWQFLTLKPKGL